MKYFVGIVLFLFVFSGAWAQNTPSTSKKHSTKPKPVTASDQSTKLTAGQPTKKEQISAKKLATSHKSAPELQKGSTKTVSRPKKNQTAKGPVVKPKTLAPKPPSENEEYTKAIAVENLEERVAALKTFLEKFPATKKKNDTLDSIAVARIQLAQDRLTTADTESGITILKAAVGELPTPVPEKLYNDSISKIPPDLFNNGQRVAAIEIATVIEGKIGEDAGQMLNLAQFFLMTENGAEAKSLADKAIAITPTSNAYQTLGLACRLNFQLDEASQAYTKALELEPESPVILRNLADLKRAQGKSDDALNLYNQILAKDAANVQAETGLILTLFDAGKRADAEAEMGRSLEQNPNNVILLAGAAYWYAGHNEPDKAIDYSQQAIEKEPRYVWSHIALAHGYLAKKQPATAEQILLKARAFGNFPTLEYEIASARLMSGFYRDAADELRKSFWIKDGVIHTKLGGRVDADDEGFIEVLANERRASTLEPESADDKETAARLKSLLDFEQTVNAKEPNEDEAAKAADAFVNGDDPMKVHRQLYAASDLLGKRLALAKVAELAQAAVGNTDSALDVPDPGAAVMASELYDSRALALTRNELIKVPQVPRATLSAILRGRIEEIAGWTLFYQDKPADAVVRLRRAVSVMPADSAWWRSSMWKLGAALQADGKDIDALDSYIKSYSIDKPDGARYSVVESLYKRVHGNTDGLEAKIGANPVPVVSQVPDATKVADVEEPQNAGAHSSGGSEVKAGSTASAKNSIEAASTPETVASPTPQASPTVPDPTPNPTTEVTPTSVATATRADATPTPDIDAAPTSQAPVVVAPTPSPVPETTPSSPEVTESSIAKTDAAKTEPSPTLVNETLTEKPSTATDQKSTDPETSATPTKKRDNSAVPSNTSRQLFEPVIITVPKRNIPKSSGAPAEKKTGEADSAAGTEKKLETNDPENSKSQKPEPEITPARVASEKETDSSVTPECPITVSQESISILNSGGSLGILVRMEGVGELKSIKAVTNSPDDVQVTLEPEIAGVKGQAFYVIHSVTAKTGDFTVAFIAPCGRKEMSVTVR